MSGFGTYRVDGYDIPIDLMNLTGGGPDWFEASSTRHFGLLQKYVGIEPHFGILEIGCGIGRDAIPLTKVLSAGAGGVYTGTDLVKASIDWCNANIRERHPHFFFHHLDIEDEIYNPSGTLRNRDVALPFVSASVDRIIAQSVFTHMLQEDVEHYLAEFRRVLRPGGRVFTTTFIYDDAILEKARALNVTQYNLRFDHVVSDCCRVNDLERPTVAVACTLDALDQMVRRAGLSHFHPPLRGHWSGYFPETEDRQDALILAAP